MLKWTLTNINECCTILFILSLTNEILLCSVTNLSNFCCLEKTVSHMSDLVLYCKVVNWSCIRGRAPSPFKSGTLIQHGDACPAYLLV